MNKVTMTLVGLGIAGTELYLRFLNAVVPSAIKNPVLDFVLGPEDEFDHYVSTTDPGPAPHVS